MKSETKRKLVTVCAHMGFWSSIWFVLTTGVWVFMVTIGGENITLLEWIISQWEAVSRLRLW